MKLDNRGLWVAIGSTIILSLGKIVDMVGILGDIDTVCSVAGYQAVECSASRVVEFLVDPPGWLLLLVTTVSLLVFLKSERERERQYIADLSKLNREFYDLSGRHYMMLDRLEPVIEQIEGKDEITEEKAKLIADFTAQYGPLVHSLDWRQHEFRRQIQEIREEAKAFIDGCDSQIDHKIMVKGQELERHFHDLVDRVVDLESRFD